MHTNQNPIIVGLDIGTTKIVAIAAQKNEFGKMEVIGFGKAESNGVNHGVVQNLEKCIRSIEKALENLKISNVNLEVHNVYVGIAGQHIKSIPSRGDLTREDAENIITKEEIQKLINDRSKEPIPAGDQIIDIIPTDFTVDGTAGLKLSDVIGMNGTKIGANFHIITGDRNAIRNIERCIKEAGLNAKDIILQPLASAAAVLSDEDLEAGVAIVDIGGGTTDMAVFVDGILRHTAVIPFAGTNITNDIRTGLGVLKSQAEQLKVKFGSAIAQEANSNEFISIPGIKGLPTRELSSKNLSGIIQARMEEILEYVVYHLKQQDLEKRLNGGIIITGGGSSLKNLKQLTEFKTALNTRVGLPIEHLTSNFDEALANPMYSTCIGLILKGFLDLEGQTEDVNAKNTMEACLAAEHDEETQKDEIKKEAGTVSSSKVTNESKSDDMFMDFEDEFNDEESDSKEDKPKGDTPIKIGIIKIRKSVSSVYDTFKKSLKDLFSEKEDNNLN
ncbi:MAG TPA: cell division protein FtsA [Edaphocola sp.]|nr:cell division protein FtsA [Edaphocola sp.]